MINSTLHFASTCILIYFAKKFPPVQPYLIQFLDFYLVKYQIKIQVDQKLVCLYAYSILYAYLIVKSKWAYTNKKFFVQGMTCHFVNCKAAKKPSSSTSLKQQCFNFREEMCTFHGIISNSLTAN